MSALTDTLVVLPAFNEEGSVADVVREVLSKLPGVSCLVVDDGSRDSTARLARGAGAAVASLPFNLGVGAAMRVGFRYASEHGFANVIQIDADGQHDPATVPRMLDQLDEVDIVIAARFAGVGDYDVRGPRRWAMRVLAFTLSRVTGARLTDATSGFRASGPRAIAVFVNNYPAEYLGDTVESLVIAARSGLKVRQIPTEMRPRAAGVPSHNPARAAAYLGRAIMALIFALVRPQSSYDIAEVAR
jgi:glycosyltransferase involved in cell wall biosynthesis